MSYFDIVIGVIILLLGLKGILNGFFRELFGLVGIVGGVFIASRFGTFVGETLLNPIFHLQNKAAINFAGFVLTLGIFWLIMVGIGLAFQKLSSVSGLGSLDKVMGFVVLGFLSFRLRIVSQRTVCVVKRVTPCCVLVSICCFAEVGLHVFSF